MKKTKIQARIIALMQKRGVTYDMVAQELGCSRQNVWSALNDRPHPAFYVMREILNGFGYDFDFVDANKESADEKTKQGVFKAAEKTKGGYAEIEATMQATGYKTVIVRKSKMKD